MIHLYVGNGRGKTTAVVGLAIRMLDNGQKVLLASFLKNGQSGEMQWLENNSEVKLLFQKDLHKFVPDMNQQEYEKTKSEQLKLLGAVLSDYPNYDAVILDEFTDIIDVGMINIVEAVDIVKRVSKKCELLITGHNALNNLVELADYYTEFVSHKHPYVKGVKARKGIEF